MVLELFPCYAYTVRTQGELSSTFYSEELYNAEKIGYKYSIKSGYLFEKFDVFSEFIENIKFKLKKQVIKMHDMQILLKHLNY